MARAEETAGTFNDAVGHLLYARPVHLIALVCSFPGPEKNAAFADHIGQV